MDSKPTCKLHYIKLAKPGVEGEGIQVEAGREVQERDLSRGAVGALVLAGKTLAETS
jgi:hypothetical protein